MVISMIFLPLDFLENDQMDSDGSIKPAKRGLYFCVTHRSQKVVEQTKGLLLSEDSLKIRSTTIENRTNGNWPIEHNRARKLLFYLVHVECIKRTKLTLIVMLIQVLSRSSPLPHAIPSCPGAHNWVLWRSCTPPQTSLSSLSCAVLHVLDLVWSHLSSQWTTENTINCRSTASLFPEIYYWVL